MAGGTVAFFDSIHDAGTKLPGFGLQIIGTRGIVDLRADREPLAPPHYGQSVCASQGTAAMDSDQLRRRRQAGSNPELTRQVMEHVVAARDLIAAIAENRQPLCNMNDGRTVMEMIAAVFESQRQNGERVTFPLQTRENPLARL